MQRTVRHLLFNSALNRAKNAPIFQPLAAQWPKGTTGKMVDETPGNVQDDALAEGRIMATTSTELAGL